MLQKKIDLELSNKLDSWQWIEFKTETLKLPESDKCTLTDIFAGLFDEIDELKSRVYDLENPDGPFDRDDFMYFSSGFFRSSPLVGMSIVATVLVQSFATSGESSIL